MARRYSSALLTVLADAEFWANYLPSPDDEQTVDATAMTDAQLMALFG